MQKLKNERKIKVKLDTFHVCLFEAIGYNIE